MTQRFCLVTGAGRDIGRATAEALSGPGVHTLLHHAASAAGAREALAAIRAAGGDGTLIHADFADPEAIQRCAATIRQILGDGHLHTVVHNAAIAAATPLTDDVAGVAQAMLNVNVLAPTLLTHALADHIADGGSVLALSVAATDKVFSPDFGLFSASKAALDALVRNWAAALGPRRIRVNGIAPGIVAVNFRAALLEDPGFRQQLEADTALGRAAQIDDVLDVITFLTSDTARWITGQVIEASGGWRL